MLDEQDLIDKKNISLMGYKKNQQILGTNQYAMQNNFTKSITVKNSDTKKFWDLRNKDKEYNEVVNHATVKVNENIRGMDKNNNRHLNASADFSGSSNQNPLNTKIINQRLT